MLLRSSSVFFFLFFNFGCGLFSRDNSPGTGLKYAVGESCSDIATCLNTFQYCSGGGEFKVLPCSDRCLGQPTGTPDICMHEGRQIFKLRDISSSATSPASPSSSGSVQGVLDQAVRASCGQTSDCGASIKLVGSNDAHQEGFWNKTKILPSWSAVKLLMIAATVQRYIELGGDISRLDSQQLPCGMTFYQGIVSTLVDSSNTSPACILKYMENLSGISHGMVLDFVGGFTDPNRLANKSVPGSRHPGYEICRWAPYEDANSAEAKTYNLWATNIRCSTANNGMSPEAVVSMLNAIWSDPRLSQTKQTMIRYLDMRNAQIFAAYPDLKSKEYLNHILHKTGSVPEYKGSSRYSNSDFGVVKCGNGNFYAYSYFDGRWIESYAGTAARFRFWENLVSGLKSVGCY